MWISTPHIPPDFRGPSDRPFTRFGDPATSAPILQRLAAVVQRRGAALAVADADHSLSFEQLWEWAMRLAQAIGRTRTGNGPVAVLLPCDQTYVVAVFACLSAGRAAVLLDASYPEARNQAIIAATGASLLIAKGAARLIASPNMDSLDPHAAFDERPTWPRTLDGADRLGLEAPAFILATSGSSGRPKTIVHSQRTMLHWARTSHDGMHLNEEDRVLSVSSLSALGGFTALLSTPLAGAAMQLFDIKSQKITGLFDLLGAGSVSILRAAPSLLRSIAALPDAAFAFARLRIVQLYGEPLLMSDVQQLRKVLAPTCLIRSTYGSTESSGLTWYASSFDSHDPVRVPVGTLMPDTEAAILADDGTPCEHGSVGELVIRSRYNALGEWVDGKLIAGRLEPDPLDPARRIYRTGDLARCDGDGVFVVLGRKDSVLKINGQRVDPGEIEAAIRMRADISDIAILPARRSGTISMMAFIVPKRGAPPDLEARIRVDLRAALPAFMMPSRFYLIDAMPRLPGGKFDAQALYACAEARA